MDLEGFNNLDRSSYSTTAKNFDVRSAIEYIDAEWYTRMARRARWMDLLGDYAGSEPFIIDGESLLQLVLDDPLLAIGQTDCSFQILHGLQSLERILVRFIQRGAVFQIVFWEETRHVTLHTGGSLFAVASRSLARKMLMQQLFKLDVVVHTFHGLSDENWLQYNREAKPMFVMINDGGLLEENVDWAAECILCQRVFIHDLLSQGLPLALLKGSEFRDSKILSFVYEQRRDSKARKLLAEELWKIAAESQVTLEARDKTIRIIIEQRSPAVSAIGHQPTLTRDFYLLEMARCYLSSKPSKAVPLELLYGFIAHCVLLENISVQERSRPPERLHQKLSDIISMSFFPTIFFVLEKIVGMYDATIDVDGRVFASLISLFIKNHSYPMDDLIGSMDDLIGSMASRRVQYIWTNLNTPLINLRSFSDHFPSPIIPQPPINSNTNFEPLHLLPFDHDIFNEQLKSVHVIVEDNPNSQSGSSTHLNFGQGTLFSDTQHWHSAKKILPSHLGGADPKPLDEWQRNKLLRAEQRFMATLHRQAGTLTGASGGALSQISIMPVGSRVSKPSRSQPIVKEKLVVRTKGKKETVQLSSKEKLLKEISDKKKSVQDTASQGWWRDQVESINKMTNAEKIFHVQTLYRNKRTREASLITEMHLYRLHLELNQWIDELDKDKDLLRDRYTVSIMRMVKDICDQKNVTPTILTCLRSVLTTLGFSDYGASIDAQIEDRHLEFKFIRLLKSKGSSPLYKFMRITEDCAVWQLRLFGEFMDRSMDGEPDARVAFEPDAWQRKVLNCIDENNSLLVVAPTSAGKTFISFYAMEKVLRGSDDGIIVYVAPTKALVSQIAAEVYARFSKNLNGRSCWSIHTRDYRVHDPQKCQILVTVPEMLATMLLSPPLAKVWTPRLKYIILDEIHSIGQQEGGAVWEQIILLAPCPIIGLSATVGEPEKFSNWLQSVQKSHGYKYAFVSHPHRYSHLRKFYYDLHSKPEKSFNGLDVYQSSQRSKFLHPISMLAFGTRSLPSDLALEASDTLSLYHALLLHKDTIKVDLDSLEPSKFFLNAGFLRQKDVLRYEEKLKEVLLELMASCDPRDPSSPLSGVIQYLTDPAIAQMSDTILNIAPNPAQFRGNLIYLIADLHIQGDLPAILFSFDRRGCEIMAEDLLNELQKAEEIWRDGSPEWTRKLDAWERWKSSAKDRERLIEKAKKQKKDPDAPEPPGSHETSWESVFDPEDPSPQFSFAGTHSSYSKSDLANDIESLGRGGSAPEWVLRALRRGIAVHHSGMNKRYRSLVESLFRQGFVRVVVATGTLALGINAPTKTSIFAGDSAYLTALLYRQCAGRAGRRGYDLLGKVVFYGLAMDRVQRLVLSKLPSLGGGFPLTSTLCLRLFNLLDGSDNADVAKNAIQSLMNLPQISFGSSTGRNQLLHHLRFSIDYLRRAHLLDRQGRPMNLFSIAAHLYYTEPSNLALVSLMRNGVLHRICRQPSIDQAKWDFILLMSHLFGRRYLPRSYTTQQNIDLIVKKSPSMVVLPPLTSDARSVLVEHDREILRVFSAYALTYASQYATQLGPDSQLPLSKRDYSGSSVDSNSFFRTHLKLTAIPVVARSPFVANSGHGDKFASVEELTRTVRHGFDLNEHAIPSLGRLTARPERTGDLSYGLNAYILDFYVHGQVKALAAANGIRSGDVWYLLQDFMLSLTAVKAGLEQLLLKMSKEREIIGGDEDGEERDLDAAYGSFDPGEADEDNTLVDANSFKRPKGVTDGDWRVYEVVASAAKEFEEKFRAMWA